MSQALEDISPLLGGGDDVRASREDSMLTLRKGLVLQTYI